MSKFRHKSIVKQPEIKPLGDIKIQESRGFLAQVKSDLSAVITKIRTETQKNENDRRILEEVAKKERSNKIQTEVITSHKKNVEIDWTW